MTFDFSATRGHDGPRVVLSGRILAVLVLGGMAATTNAQMFALLLSPLADDLGISVARLGGLRTLEEVTAILTGIALTPVIDRFPRRSVLMLGFALTVAAAAVAASTVSVPMIVSYFLVDGTAKILLFASLLAMPSDLASGHEHDRALGFVIGSFSLTGFTIIPLAGLLTDAYSWRAGYFLSIALAMVTFMLVALLVPRVQTGTRAHDSLGAHARALARLPGFPAGLIGAFLRFTMYSAVLTYSGAFFIDEHGVSVRLAGVYFSLGSIGFLLASVTSAALIRRAGLRGVLVPGGVLAAALVGVGYGSGLPLGITGACLLLASGMMGFLENASTGLLLRLAPDDRGAAMSLNELGAASGSLLGIGVCALALRWSGFTGIGVFLALVGLAAAVVTSIALAATLRATQPEPATVS